MARPRGERASGDIPTGVGAALLVGVLLVVAVVAVKPWRRLASPPAPPTLTVDGVGFLWTTGTVRCGEVRFESWCDEMPKPLPGMTTTRELRGRKKVLDDSTFCKKMRRDEGASTADSHWRCRPRFEDVYGDKCRATKWAWTSVSSYERDVRGRDPGPGPAAPPPLECTAARAGEERAATPTSQGVLFVRSAEGKTWRCAVDDATWARYEPGASIALATAPCAAQ